jgi:hypothetical protein
MARKAIQDLYRRLQLLEQELRLLRPRKLELSSLLDLPEGRRLYAEAPPFMPMDLHTTCKLPEYPGVAKDSANCSEGGVCLSGIGLPAAVPFGDYYHKHFKAIDVYSLESLRGRWEPLPDHTALDQAIELMEERDFAGMLSLMCSNSYVEESILKVVPLYVQREEASLKEAEARITATQSDLDRNCDILADMRDRASRLLDSTASRQEAGPLLRELEARIAGSQTVEAELRRDKEDTLQLLLRQKLYVRMWKELDSTFRAKCGDRVAALQRQWRKAGLQ